MFTVSACKVSHLEFDFVQGDRYVSDFIVMIYLGRAPVETETDFLLFN